MSRNYAQIFTAIWRDPDFIALTRSRQQAYFLLVTQSNISAAGVLPLTVRRWAKLSAETTTAELLADIAHLHRVGMVVVDEDTEELLIRSFVRHDNGYRNPRRQPSIRDAAADIESPLLRRALARELVRLDCPGWLPEMAEVNLSAQETPPTPIAGTFPQVNSHSDSHSDSQTGIDEMANRFQTARTATPNPQPPTRNPSVPPSAGGAAAVDEPPLFDDLPGAEATNQATPLQRAFGVARWWIELRKQRGTPVVASGRDGALHKLKSLIKPFAESGYLDGEIKQALEEVAESIPSSAQLDRTLTRIREGVSRSTYERRSGYPSSYPDRTGIAARDSQHVSPATRKFQRAQDLAAQLDQQYANGAAP